MNDIKPHKRTRQERKQAQRQQWANREQYEREHPVLSGAVKIVDYVPPKGFYVPVQSQRIVVDSACQVLRVDSNRHSC